MGNNQLKRIGKYLPSYLDQLKDQVKAYLQKLFLQDLLI